MLGAAVLGRSSSRVISTNPQVVTLKGVSLACGVINLPDPDPERPLFPDQVMIRVRAFSCNYRDQSLMLQSISQDPEYCICLFGSEFVAEVVRVAPNVEKLAVGDRVVADHAYAGANFATGRVQGVISNQASLEYQIHDQCRLQKVPAGMGDAEAAAFSLNFQTAFSMVRRAGLKPGQRILVTSGFSNVSIALLNLLSHQPVEVFVCTTSPYASRLAECFTNCRVITGKLEVEVGLIAAGISGFDVVFDPFFDLNAPTILHSLRPFGKYITCGLLQQPGVIHQVPNLSLTEFAAAAIANNLEVHFNCLGDSEDLSAALAFASGHSLRQVVDSVFSDNLAAFLRRTFEDRSRFGKVVYCYRDTRLR